jgi:hypothetical protein
MRKLLTIFALLLSLCASAQTDYVPMTTYDTTLGVFGGVTWTARITRPISDTNARPTFITMPGAGEVGTDTNNLVVYGPHYWLNNGWDGGIQLGNGRHFPILITLLSSNATVRGNVTTAVIDSIRHRYRIKWSSIHLAGLSQGVWILGHMLIYNSASSTASMDMIRSFVDLEGVTPSDNFAGDAPLPTPFVTWAGRGGRFMGIWGSTDSQDRNGSDSTKSGRTIPVAMNGSFPGTGFSTYENYSCSGVGAGGHGCWNNMYDPSVTDWLTGSQVVAKAAYTNQVGSYFKPSSIFQWMLRQGDTALVASTPQPVFIPIQEDSIAAGEYVTGRIYSDGSLWTFTGGTALSGSNQQGNNVYMKVSGANTYRYVSNTLHGISAITSDRHLFSFGGNDCGQLGLGYLTPVPADVYTPQQSTVDSSGKSVMENITIIKGCFTGNFAQGLYIVKAGSGSDSLFYTGAWSNGIRGDGSAGADTVSSPVLVWAPAGRRFKQLVGGKYGVALLDDGTVWTTGAGGTGSSATVYALLGYTPTNSATDYLTWHQVTGFDAADSIRLIAGGDVGGTIALGKSHSYVWGPFNQYLGESTAGSWPTPHNSSATLDALIPGGIRYLAARTQTFHAISTLDSLYGWGDNACGTLGDGNEANMTTIANPYFVDPAAKFGLMVYSPKRISNKGNWKAVFGSPLFGFSTFALDRLDSLYVSGRGKGGVLGDGVQECTGANGYFDANRPNSFDRPYVTQVTPKAILAPIPTYPPGCANGTFSTNCSVCARPATTLVANAGADQTISGTSTMLDASGSTVAGGSIISYVWSQVSGSPVVMDVQAGKQIHVSGLSGTSVFRLTTTDNGQFTSTDDVTITQTSGGGTPPTANAGPDVILIGSSSITLHGSGAAVSPATSIAYLWTKISGPGATTITGNTTASPTISGLQLGEYVFQIKVTDNLSNFSTATMHLFVIPFTNYLTFPKRVKTH